MWNLQKNHACQPLKFREDLDSQKLMKHGRQPQNVILKAAGMSKAKIVPKFAFNSPEVFTSTIRSACKAGWYPLLFSDLVDVDFA